MADESKKTVLVALAANVVVGIIKFAGAALTGSSALFAEGAESISDILNETFLLAGVSQGRRPADAEHPFGYGRERFFWSLLAAVGILVGGAGFSLIEAYQAFTGSSTVADHYYLIAYVTLGLVALAEGTSWLRAVRQLRGEARQRQRGVIEHLRKSTDPSVLTVASEDTVAVVGVVMAAAGIGLHQATGQGWWEGVSAVLIAVLLIVTAFLLGRDVKDLLIGESVDPGLREELCDLMSEHPAVDDVVELLTMRIGADEVLLAARLDLHDDVDAAAVERASHELDQRISERWPEITQVFLDATGRAERADRQQLLDSPAAGGRAASS